MYETILKTEADLEALMPLLADSLVGKEVMALDAPMGAGKTTLVRHLMTYLGSSDAVSSPTFSIVNEYRTGDKRFPLVFHMDLYRLRSIDEALALPIEDYLYGGGLCIIEWPGLVETLLPESVLRVQIFQQVDGARKIVFL